MEDDNLIAFSRDIKSTILYQSIPLYTYILCSLIDDVKNGILYLMITMIHKIVKRFIGDLMDRIGCQKNTYCIIRKYLPSNTMSMQCTDMNGNLIIHNHLLHVFEKYCIKLDDLKKNIYYMSMIGYKVIVIT